MPVSSRNYITYRDGSNRTRGSVEQKSFAVKNIAYAFAFPPQSSRKPLKSLDAKQRLHLL